MSMRKKTIILFFCLFLLVFLTSFVKNRENTQTSVDTPDNPAADLQVTFVSPKGKTEAPHEAETIVVVFDQVMIPLEALSERKAPPPVRMNPSFSGKWRWLNTRTMTFTPEKHFPYATQIEVSIPAGTESLKGAILKKDFTWTFQTIRPRLIKHAPRNNQQWLNLDTQILLVFNQTIQKNRAKDFLNLIEMTPAKKETAISFRLDTPSQKKLKEENIKAKPEEVLILIPEKKLKPDCSYYVEIKQGLPGKEGSLGMAKSQIFKFETFNTFKFNKLGVDKEHTPYDPLPFHFSNPVIYKEFVKHIRFEPALSIPDYYSRWDRANSTLRLTLPFQPETEYTLWIDADLEDEFGNRLQEKVKQTFLTSPYPPSASIDTGHGIIEAYGDLRYPLYVINSKKVFLQGAQVQKEQVIPLLMTEKIFWVNEKYAKANFFRLEKLLEFQARRNKREIFPIALKEILTDKHGFVFLQLDTYSSDDWERYPKAFLQVTELGISGKFSPENNIIWVTELKTGRPVPEAQVEIRDDSNKIRWQGQTDSEGKVQTPGWKILGIKTKEKWQKPRQWVFVSRGADVALTTSEWGTGIYPYRFGIHYDWNPQPVKIQGYLFTEKGIYRAGETVHIKGVIREREKGEWQLPRTQKVECEILDPFQKRMLKKTIELDAYGSFALDFEAKEEASLGYYQIRGIIPSPVREEKPITVYGSFQIEAFQPAEFEVHLRTSKESYIFGDTYEAAVRANYLFGGAMADQKVSWRLRLNPDSFSPPGHNGYIFGNQIDRWVDFDGETSRLLSSGESTLDREGKFTISAKLLPEKEKDSVLAALEATVVSPSRRMISSRVQAVVHRGEYYIGLKPSTTFLKKDHNLEVNLISVSPEGQILPEKQIRLALIRREWLGARRRGIGGMFRWLSDRKDTEIAHHLIQTKDKPQKVTFRPEKSGFYLLRAEGTDSRDNAISTITYVYVTGRDYVPWEQRDDDSIELVADLKEYRPGDVAKILVKSPYQKAKALVTIERELILDHKILELQGSSEEIEIPILSDHIPNVFVSVLLVQGRTSTKATDKNEDIGKPQFKLGYINLNVNPSEKRLNIEIQKDKETYKPREEVHLKLKVNNWKGQGTKASLTLAVVDVGVLSLIGYLTPDPFLTFYAQRSLSVQTSDTRLHLIGMREYGQKGEDVGGGGEETDEMKASAPALAEVKLRGDFKATAYWNPALLTDEEGNVSVSFTLPDNLTTFRIMAVAQTKDSRFGQAQSDLRTSKPLLLLPALPRFTRTGDRFSGGVVIYNNSSKPGQISLSCEAGGVLLLDENPVRQFSLEAGKSREILFDFEAEKPGEAIFAYRAKMGKETDGLEISIPVLMPRPTETVAFFEKTSQSDVQSIRIPENIYADESKIEVFASASALTGLRGCVDYLTSYPYLCLEQRLSSILPYIVAEGVILDFSLSQLDKSQIREYVRKTLREIYAYQKGNGGFGFWPDSTSDSPFISCYAAFALIQAKRAGYDVNPQLLTRAANYLQSLLRPQTRRRNHPYSDRSWKTVQAFALYDLALLTQPKPAYAEKLFTERENLSLFGKTLLLKALFQGKGPLSAQTALALELTNKIKVEPTQAHFEDDEGREGGWIYASNLRTTAFILQAMLEVGSDHPLLPDIARWIVQKRKANAWNSTQQNFFVFYALNEFYRQHEKIKPDFEIEISLEKKRLLQEVFREIRNKTVAAETSLVSFPPGKTIPLNINMKGQGTLFYEARMTYAPRYRLVPRDEGFGLSKQFLSLDGESLESVKAGSLVVVKLQIVVPQESLFVVVDDPLPAGFEAVNPTFVTESQEQQRSLSQMERLRNRRWWEGFNHIEMHDDRVLLFADSLSPGVHTHTYLARALTFGTFQTPGTKIEEMYSPEVFGRGEEFTVKIEK